MKKTEAAGFSGRMDRLFEQAPEMRLAAGGGLVVFSDLHLGDGGGRDDFKKNAGLFLAAMRRHYLPGKFTLVLNGDIEELALFPLARIVARWPEVYDAWREFADRGALFKLVGNHDLALLRRSPQELPLPVGEALKVRQGGHLLFLAHGHQAWHLNWAFQTLGILFLRWLLSPLGFGNYTVARSSRRRYNVEKRMYGFARRKRVMMLIGHTHRPLFESLPRLDSVKIEIETLCRGYVWAAPERQAEMERKLALLQAEYVELQLRDRRPQRAENLYHPGPLLPCLFNSGCGIGRNGITAIEVVDGRAALVYWFDRGRSEKFIEAEGYEAQRLADTDFYRVVLKQEELGYIFTRINLLGKKQE